MTTIWQIGTGTDWRSYHNTFFRHDLMLIGPGNPGAWPWDQQTISSRRADARFVRYFATQIRAGDLVVMRVNSQRVFGVGRVLGDYTWLEQFNDVDGWDLQHARRVKWLDKPHDFGAKVFGRARRLSRATVPAVVEWARSAASTIADGPLAALPVQQPLVDLDALEQPIRAIIDIVATLRRLGSNEREMIVHVVVPLLQALGWPRELIAVEWKNIDIAVFRALPRRPENLVLVVEAKRPDKGTHSPWYQAKGYLGQQAASAKILVTDGVRYRLSDDTSADSQIAYANLLSLKAPSLELFDHLRPDHDTR